MIYGVHKFLSIKSSTKCLLIQTNSPDKTLLVYRFVVYGSKLSLLPNIYEVDAVGIGAINNEFLIPWILISFFKVSQSYPFVGTLFHKSNYNFPSLAGEPLNV